jgi:hypothetical protein
MRANVAVKSSQLAERVRHLTLAIVAFAVALAAVLALTTRTAKAADGSSGCGPAWYVLKDMSILSSSLRSTTNGFLMPTVTFGMTSGTSNCAQHKLVLEQKRDLHFATMNRDALMSEMAAGRGEFLDAFAATVGCPVGVRNHFGASVQSAYSSIWTSDAASAEDVVGRVHDLVRDDLVLASTCGAAT